MGAIMFKYNVPEITEPGKYRFKILDVQVLNVKGKDKILVNSRPYALDSDQEFVDIALWFNMYPKEREDSFFNAIGNIDDLQKAVGMYVGGEVSFNTVEKEEGEKTYRNVDKFFPIVQSTFVSVSEELPF